MDLVRVLSAGHTAARVDEPEPRMHWLARVEELLIWSGTCMLNPAGFLPGNVEFDLPNAFPWVFGRQFEALNLEWARYVKNKLSHDHGRLMCSN